MLSSFDSKKNDSVVLQNRVDLVKTAILENGLGTSYGSYQFYRSPLIVSMKPSIIHPVLYWRYEVITLADTVQSGNPELHRIGLIGTPSSAYLIGPIALIGRDINNSGS